jgi:hypothetical protein
MIKSRYQRENKINIVFGMLTTAAKHGIDGDTPTQGHCSMQRLYHRTPTF